MTDNTQQITVFLDMLGRTIIGVLDSKQTNKDTLAVVNPAVLNIVPTQQGSMQVQIIPMIFRELQAEREQDVTWVYNRTNITESQNMVPSFQITSQYQNVVSPTPQANTPVPPADTPSASNDDVIKLFDD